MYLDTFLKHFNARLRAFRHTPNKQDQNRKNALKTANNAPFIFRASCFLPFPRNTIFSDKKTSVTTKFKFFAYNSGTT